MANIWEKIYVEWCLLLNHIFETPDYWKLQNIRIMITIKQIVSVQLSNNFIFLEKKKSSHAWLLLKIHELHKNANKINEDLSCCRPNCQALCWQPTFNEVYHDQIIVIVIELLYKFSWWCYLKKVHLWKFKFMLFIIPHEQILKWTKV